MATMRSKFEGMTEPEVRKAVKAMRAALRRMRSIAAGRTDGTDFDLFVARQRVQALEREIAKVERELANRLRDAAGKAVRYADQLNPTAPENLVGVDATITARAQADAARFVKDITDRMRAEVNRAVTRAVSGEMDRAEFESSLFDALDPDVNEARVERVARTELGSVFERQGQEADARLADRGADLVKVWWHKCGGRMCLGAREDHVALHGQERELWEPFSVGNGATAKTKPGSGVGIDAMRPLDAALPAEHVINCGCTVIRRPRSQRKQSYTAKVNPRSVPADS